MGVFDGSDYRVSVYRKSDEDPEDPETFTPEDARSFVENLRKDPDVRAVETHAIHYVIGNYYSDLSFGNPYEGEEDE
ncbi:hypothetical protein ASD97_25860 [Streptomyces sp. Root63]|uniref:hypothetical protein n=1 Tax=unclassified Streptomyces TaxID=2593676 RepID=UPI0006F7BB63|nr:MULTISPECIES: hypothetical protein [unclassified Streptomyces]KQX43502.1 hypothetical protein ASD29_32165 [Streptomyces sp. Root1295]KRA34065.1 hypothetical protein ASD97_25860 [Streptomyces sp. Root63]